MDEQVIEIVLTLQQAYAQIEKLKEQPGAFDGRALACSLTRLDEALLWLANARK